MYDMYRDKSIRKFGYETEFSFDASNLFRNI